MSENANVRTPEVITTFTHQTSSRAIQIERLSVTVPTAVIHVDEVKFGAACQANCCNYGTKHSCPPSSPSFRSFAKTCKTAHVVCFRLFLDSFAPLPTYSRVRAGNAVLKAQIDRELRGWKSKGHLVAGSGSCRACKPCGARTDEPCKKPQRKIYSLEAMGVDVNHLVRRCFGFSLEWYRKRAEAPAHTCVVGAVLGNFDAKT